MTHFSLKSAALAASVLALSASMSAFAAPIKTECSKDPLFAANTCEVCYTETQTPTKTSTGWTAELSDFLIPWDHSGSEFSEIITESTIKLPEMIPSADVKVTPNEADKIWEFSTDVVWYAESPDRESIIEK